MARAFRRFARHFVAAGTLLLATSAHASYWTQLFVFGDSLSDSGNAASLSEAPPPPVPGLISYFPPSGPSPIPGDTRGIPYDFRFSNGPVAAEYLALSLGLTPSLPAWPAGNVANQNYAVGGAMTGTWTIPPAPTSGNYNWAVDSPPGLQLLYPALQDTGLDAQVALFTSRVSSAAVSFDPTTTLFSVWGGANDIFLGLDLGLSPGDLNALLFSAAVNVATRIGELAAAGGMHFLVINLPDLGLTPLAIAEGPVAQVQLTMISQGFNDVLSGALAPLKASGLDIIEFDAFSAFQAMIANAEGQGFNVSEPCFDGLGSIPTVLAGCPGYIYFDSVHPTTYAHSLIAARLAVAVPEPGVLSLLAAALLAVAVMRRLRRRLPA